MDPNVTYEQVVQLAGKILNERVTRKEQAKAGAELAEAIMNLDHWLVNGGFLPGAWEIAEGARASDDQTKDAQG